MFLQTAVDKRQTRERRDLARSENGRRKSDASEFVTFTLKLFAVSVSQDLDHLSFLNHCVFTFCTCRCITSYVCRIRRKRKSFAKQKNGGDEKTRRGG